MCVSENQSQNMPSISEASSSTNVPSSSANLPSNNNNTSNSKRSHAERTSQQMENSRNNTAGLEYEDNSSEQSNESPEGFDTNVWAQT